MISSNLYNAVLANNLENKVNNVSAPTQEQIQESVDNYLTEHPVPSVSADEIDEIVESLGYSKEGSLTPISKEDYLALTSEERANRLFIIIDEVVEDGSGVDY